MWLFGGWPLGRPPTIGRSLDSAGGTGRARAPARAGVGVAPGREHGRLAPVALDGTRVRADDLAEESRPCWPRPSGSIRPRTRPGANSRGGQLPEHLRRREIRLANIREAKAALEAEVRQQAGSAARRPHGRGDDNDTTAGEAATTAGKATPKPKMQRVLVGAVLLALTFAGGYCVAVHKNVTLSVDGLPKTVSTMKSRVFDVVRENGFAVGDHDELYPPANQPVHQSDTIVLRRGRPLQVSIDGQQSKQVWTTATTVDEALKRAVDERCRSRRGVAYQRIAAGRHGAAAGESEET